MGVSLNLKNRKLEKNMGKRKVHEIKEDNLFPLSKPIRYVKTHKGCWKQISHIRKRYGHVVRNGKQHMIHRYVFTLLRGEIPENKVLLHSCDNIRCINPDHLTVGTQKDNIKDMMAKGRNNQAKGEEQGHSKLTDIEVIEILKLAVNTSPENLASMYNVHKSTIYHILEGIAWRHIERPKDFKYVKNISRKKLSEEQREDIRKDNRKNRVIAKEYNVSESLIGKVKKGIRR